MTYLSIKSLMSMSRLCTHFVTPRRMNISEVRYYGAKDWTITVISFIAMEGKKIVVVKCFRSNRAWRTPGKN